MSSDFKNLFGFLVDKFSELVHTIISLGCRQLKGGPSSSCEMIILRNNSHGEIKGVCMGIFTTALRKRKNKSNSHKKYSTLLLQCVACYLTAYYVEGTHFSEFSISRFSTYIRKASLKKFSQTS